MAKKSSEVLEYEYRIDLNERGYYEAHVEEAESGKIIFNITNEILDEDEEGNTFVAGYGDIPLVEDGYMKNGRDMTGLENYLIQMGFIPKYSRIKFMG